MFNIVLLVKTFRCEGGAICILKRIDYIKEVERQLSDTEYHENLIHPLRTKKK